MPEEVIGQVLESVAEVAPADISIDPHTPWRKIIFGLIVFLIIMIIVGVMLTKINF